jgi:NADH dehydrogenase
MARPGSLVTVFGGSGFVGAQVVRALLRADHRVRIAVRNPNLAYESQTQGRVGQIQRVACDVTDESQVSAALEGATAAVNLVGILYETPWRRFEAMHAEAAERIALLCKRNGIETFVQVSAIGADARSPSAYARSKGEGEARARAALPSTTVIRPSVIFGRGDSLLNRFASMASFAPALPLPGGGETRFQPVYVGDVAQAIARAVDDPSTAGQTYELGGPEVMTLREIQQLVVNETRLERPLVPLPWQAAGLIGALSEPLGWFGIAPPLTRDQVTLLKADNVVSEGAQGLEALGVHPTGIEAIAPTYLWRYRKGGQFADMAPAQG